MEYDLFYFRNPIKMLLPLLVLVVPIAYAVHWSEVGQQVNIGIVVGKRIEEERTTTKMVYNAALKMSFPQTTYHHKRLIVSVKGERNNGKTGIYEWSVSENYWNHVEINDYFRKGP